MPKFQTRKKIILILLIFLFCTPILIGSLFFKRPGNSIAAFRCSTQDEESVCGSLGYQIKLHVPKWEGLWYTTGRIQSWEKTKAVISIGNKEKTSLVFSSEIAAVCLPPLPVIPSHAPYMLADNFFIPLLVLIPDQLLSIEKIQKLYPETSTIIALTRKNGVNEHVIDRVAYFGCSSSTLVPSLSPVR